MPGDIDRLFIQLWGAGGGGRIAAGGAGAYVSGYLAVTPGETLTLLVGGGGKCTAYAADHYGGFGGGGEALGLRSAPGGGGGRSAILRGTAELVDAGGGGGGDGAGSNGEGKGGGGGVIEGQQGYNSNGGHGGTQGAGGTRGGGNATDGGFHFGGHGDLINGYGAGGGGGYYGGGGGNVTNNGGGGGGGGSSFADNLTGFIGGDAFYGNLGLSMPGGLEAPNYISGVGDGSWASNVNSGGNGEIVITASAAGTPEPGETALLTSIGLSGALFLRKRRIICGDRTS